MTTLVPRKRKINEVGASQEALYSGSPPRQRMRFNSDLASLPQNHEPTPVTMDTENNLSDNAYECPELPTEIWLDILTSGSLSEDCQAQLPFVCRSWYEISKHQTLSWWNIKEGLILKSKPSYPINSYIPVAIEFRKLKSGGIWCDDECHYNILTKNGQIQEAFALLKDSFVFESPHEYYNYAVNVQEVGNMREISYHVDIQINMRMLEKVVASGLVTTNALYALAHQAKKFIKDNEITSILDRESSTPKVPSVISTQPEIIKDVKLHQYQIDAINWMVNLELDPKSFTIKPFLHVPKSDLMIRVDDLKFVTRDQIESNTWTYCSNGGILADEIGLGKSLEIIGLIASNPPSDLPSSDTHFATKATLSTSVSDAVIGLTRALVICPSHLVKQWSAEISKYCGEKLRVIELPTIKQVRKWTYQDVLDADVVIMSYSLCSNEHYLAHPDLIQFGVDREETYSDRKARLKKLFETRKTLALAKVKGIVIEHFHWHRVVVDEYHEMDLTDLPYLSSHTWLVSGTPVITKDVAPFIGVHKVPTETGPVNEEESAPIEEKRIKFSKESEAYIFTLKQKAILKHLFWRNTKESVKQQFEMVESTEEVVKLEFTPLEATIYEYLETHPDETSDEDLLNFCCETTDETEGTEISLQKLKEEYLSICASGVKTYTYKLDRCREKYLKAVERIANQKWAWSIKEDEQTVKDYPDDSESIQDYINHFSEYQAKTDSQKASGFKNPLIDKYGTKLGNLIAYLRKLFRKDKEARVIIFSKYGPYLRLIGSILKASRVTYTVAGGNVLVKANAIRKFKEENVRVILLNLNTDASGLTLIEASHVILMDPMHGDKETALAYEQQAVGRAKRQGQRKNVTVVKFIVKNTIEEEIYNTNNAASQ